MLKEPRFNDVHVRRDTPFSSTNASYSGPYTQVSGLFDALPKTFLRLQIPLSTVRFFLDANDALEYYNEFEITKFVACMKEELDKIREETGETKVWVAQVSADLKFTKDLVIIHPSENDKVGEWMRGGPMGKLAEIFQYSPLLGGVDLQAAKESFEKGGE